MSSLDALRAELRGTAELSRQLTLGLRALEERFRDALDAFTPPVRAFERRRIIADLANPRELAYVIGVLSEGENEAALILAIAADVIAERPQAAIDHLIEEAWYYLRTSIDENWQLDDEPPSVIAALLYLAEVLDRRIAALRAAETRPPLADRRDGLEASRLRALRAASLTATVSR